MASEPAGQPPAVISKADKIYRIPFGDRWLIDAWEQFPVPGGFGLALVDMTNVQRAVRILRNAKIPATIPHLLLRAVGIAYARFPGTLAMVCNYKVLVPGALSVGLSMAGQTTYAPVVVIHAVDQKPLSVLIPDILAQLEAMAAREAQDIAALRKVVIPFKWLRQWILRVLSRSLEFRIRTVGHFQITCVNNVDIAVPFLFYSTAILSMGAIRDRVVPVDGKPAVRSTAWIGGCADHSASDGQRGGDALRYIKEILEGEDLVREAQEAAALKSLQQETNGEPRLGQGEQSEEG